MFAARGAETEVAGQIEAAIQRELDLSVRCLVRGQQELAQVVSRNPMAEVATDPARYLVTFLSNKPNPSRYEGLDPARFAPDTYVIGEREVYVWHPDGVRTSKLTHTFWEKRLGVVATARNWKTVTKLLSMLD